MKHWKMQKNFNLVLTRDGKSNNLFVGAVGGLVSPLDFKSNGGLVGPRWVRFPHAPANLDKQ